MISNRNEIATDQWFRLNFCLCGGWNQSSFSQTHTTLAIMPILGSEVLLPENKKFQ